MKTHNGMRPHDVVVLCKIVMSPKGWRNIDLAKALHISASEISYSLERSTTAGLLDHSKTKVMKLNLLDFLLFGLPYVFPAVIGPVMRGIPTAYSAPVMLPKIVSHEKLVWPYLNGQDRGESIIPLYPNAVEAALADDELYDWLALIDVLRIGKAREKKIARDLLEQKMKFTHA